MPWLKFRLVFVFFVALAVNDPVLESCSFVLDAKQPKSDFTYWVESKLPVPEQTELPTNEVLRRVRFGPLELVVRGEDALIPRLTALYPCDNLPEYGAFRTLVNARNPFLQRHRDELKKYLCADICTIIVELL